MIKIFTDGSSRGNPGPGGWAAMIFIGDRLVKELGGREEMTTNNRMELNACIKALEFARDVLRERYASDMAGGITVLSDSQYVVKGMNEWLANWKRKNWIGSNKKSVLNRDLWESLDSLSSGFGTKISWQYVAGHSGHSENERCDEIATKFADGLMSRSDLATDF